MAELINGIVLVFNLYNENKRMKDKLFYNMLEKDMENISNSLE